MPAPARGNILYKAADILEKKFDQLGAEMTREEGKTLPEAKGEVRRAIKSSVISPAKAHGWMA